MQEIIAGAVVLIEALQLFLIASRAITISHLIDELWRLKNRRK